MCLNYCSLPDVLSVLISYESHGFVLKKRYLGIEAYKPLKLLIYSQCGIIDCIIEY